MAMKFKPLKLYDHYFVDKDFERLDLFKLLAERYSITSALYPGSFVHVTPSFVYPKTVYVDSDRAAKKFFSDAGLQAFIAERKIYSQEADITFHAQDYRNDFNEPHESFDLLISQYAGFVSQACKKYLKVGGILLANNSHADASMASIDGDYDFIAVANSRNGKHSLSEKDLDLYFVSKSTIETTREYLEKTQKGIGYKKSADNYIFRRIK